MNFVGVFGDGGKKHLKIAKRDVPLWQFFCQTKFEKSFDF